MTTSIQKPLVRRRSLMLAAASPLVAWTLPGCGGGVGEAAALAQIVPFFTFTFAGVTSHEGNEAIALANIQPDEEESTEGTLGGFTNLKIMEITGVESLVRPAQGSFKGDRLRLELLEPVTPPLAAEYEGLFIASDTIRLTPAQPDPATPQLTLIRIDPSFRPRITGGSWTGTDGSGRNRTLQLQAKPDDLSTEVKDAIVFFTGTDTVDALPPGEVSGWVAMRTFELRITRGGETSVVAGRLLPEGATPPLLTPELSASDMLLDDGSRLKRSA